MLAILALPLGLFTLLYFLQDRMIYYPRAYTGAVRQLLGDRIVALDYRTAEGNQTAYYVPARSQSAPGASQSAPGASQSAPGASQSPPGASQSAPGTTQSAPGALQLPRVWLVFGGNASLALNWLDFVESFPGNESFLLIDYPGYGECAGKPSPRSILESTEAAVARLATHLKIAPNALHVSLLGHSLGAAGALAFAARNPGKTDRLTLVSPFTSLRDMARLVVGPFSVFLRHDFDNRARLAELARLERAPRIDILHGSQDEIIPVTMGRQLAREFPSVVHYLEIPGADHNGILNTAEKQIRAAMTASR